MRINLKDRFLLSLNEEGSSNNNHSFRDTFKKNSSLGFSLMGLLCYKKKIQRNLNVEYVIIIFALLFLLVFLFRFNEILLINR